MADSQKRNPTAFLFLAAVLLLANADSLLAEIYKYQNDGIWYFSDTPPDQTPEKGLKIIETARSKDETPTDTQLLTDFPARNQIEQATAATVAIKTTIGFGSGFFISEKGHIITNKHVIRPTDDQEKKAHAAFDNAATQLRTAEARLKQEERKLRTFRTRLNHLQEVLVQESNIRRKQSLQKDYEENRQTYTNWEKDFYERQQQITMARKRYEDQKHTYEYDRTLANMSTRFTIILADQSEFTANLVALGKGY